MNEPQTETSRRSSARSGGAEGEGMGSTNLQSNVRRPAARIYCPPNFMPRRTDIQSILVIGSGPIVIGQACEFDYSGTQAVKALKREGFRVVLVNSNPATIMTDPELAH